MSYTPEVAAALSGATVRQLSYWRSGRGREPLLAPEVYKPRSRVSYSFRDVVALRTFVFLKAEGISLQRIRKAVHNLRKLGELSHLSEYKLVAVGKDVVWRISADDAMDLTGHPGQGVIATMVDILRPFRNERGLTVPDLYKPKPGVRVDPEIRGGYPVVENTRIPYALVASLLRDGLSPQEVRAIYPSMGASSAEGVVEFAKYVDERRGLVAA